MAWSELVDFAYQQSMAELSSLIIDGKVELVKAVIDKHPRIVQMTFGTSSDTPLHLAVRENRTDLVEFLLKCGADINATAGANSTALHYATDEQIIKLLLARKPNLEVNGNAYETPLENAANSFYLYENVDDKFKQERARRHMKVRLLLEAGAYYDIRSAIYLNDMNRVKAIIQKEPDRVNDIRPELPENRRGAIGTPLRIAARTGRFDICKVLLAAKADPNDFEYYAGKPIMCSCMKYPKIVKLLIESGADLKKPINSEWMGRIVIGQNATALHYAVADLGTVETLELLLKHGVAIDAQDSGGQSALHLATGLGNVELAKYLVRKGARVDLMNANDRTPAEIINELAYYNAKPASEKDVRMLRELLAK